MRDGVPANRACPTLKPYDLALKAIIARQDDAATVQEREKIAEQFTLGLLGQVTRDAMLAEQLARKLAGVSVAGHTVDTVGFQQRREVIDHRIRRERRAGLANGIDDSPILGLVRDGQREAVIGAAARISDFPANKIFDPAARGSMRWRTSACRSSAPRIFPAIAVTYRRRRRINATMQIVSVAPGCVAGAPARC